MKTQQFSHAQYVGDPNNAIRIFNEKEADELIVIDIDATRSGRGPDFGVIEEFAGECYMPVTYGGGVRTMDEAARIFGLGIEKISLQSSALENPGIVEAIAGRYGSQAVTVSVDVNRDKRGHTRFRRLPRSLHAPEDWLAWMKSMTEAGAGEVLLTAVHREGTLAGIDPVLISSAASAVTVPVIANGGVCSIEDISAAFAAGASAVAAGAYFVFYGPHRAVLISYLNDRDFAEIAATR